MILFLVVVFVIAYLVLGLKDDSSSTGEKGSSHFSWISKEERLGMKGESHAEGTLRDLTVNGTTLRNLYLPTNRGTTTEVDLVWISHKGVFVIEVKNYSGWIFGNERNQYWTQVLKGGYKSQFYNPIRQNGGHIAAVRNQLWRTYQGPYFNIVVFSDHCTLKDVTFHSDRTAVIQQHQLDEYLYKTTWRLPTIIDQRRIDLIASILSEF